MAKGTYYLGEQAKLLSNYMLKIQPPDQAVTLYVDAISARPGNLNRQDKRLFAIIRAHPWLLGIIDAGLCFVSPQSEVRRRLYIMLSILEAMPDCSQYFLPKKTPTGTAFTSRTVAFVQCVRLS